MLTYADVCRYMARRLMKALEDLSIAYDETVRNSHGGIVQFRYGDDGLDPLLMENDEGRPLNLRRMLLRSQVLNLLVYQALNC